MALNLAILERERALTWQAVRMLKWMLPKPYNFASAMGRGLRMKRLARELSEFDLLLRMRRGHAASLEELCCAGAILITSRKGKIPVNVLPLDEPLLVNAVSFDLLAAWVEERLSGHDHGKPWVDPDPDHDH